MLSNPGYLLKTFLLYTLDQLETRKDKNVSIQILSLQFFNYLDVLPHTLTHGLLLEIQFSFQNFLLRYASMFSLDFHESFTMRCTENRRFSREKVAL